MSPEKSLIQTPLTYDVDTMIWTWAILVGGECSYHCACTTFALPLPALTKWFQLIFCFNFALYLSVNVFSTKVLIGDTIFTSPDRDGTAIWSGHSSDAKRAKAVPSFLSHFKNSSVGPVPGIEPASLNALQSSDLRTEWANTAVI